MNRYPSIILELKTLYKVWSSSPTNYSKLRIFDCPTSVYVKKDKLGPRARKYIFLGYVSKVKEYRLWCVNFESPKFGLLWDFRWERNQFCIIPSNLLLFHNEFPLLSCPWSRHKLPNQVNSLCALIWLIVYTHTQCICMS